MLKRGVAIVFLIVILAVGIEPSVFGTDTGNLKGAKYILDELRTANTEDIAGSQAPDEKELFKQALDKFMMSRDDMAPAKAATKWLELWDSYWTTFSKDEILSSYYSVYDGESISGISVQELIVALPSSDAWPVLKEMVEDKADLNKTPDLRFTVLRLIMDMLNSDAEGMDREIKSVNAWIKNNESARYYMGQLENLATFQSKLEGRDPSQETMKAFEALVATLEKNSDSGGSQVRIPSLVPLVGEDRARELIIRLLMIPGLELQMSSDPETAKLVRKTALANVDKLPAPPWSLVDSVDAVELYAALDKKFRTGESATPETSVTGMSQFGYYNLNSYDYSKETANGYYIFGLLVHGRAAEAIAAVDRLKMDAEGFDLNYGLLQEVLDRISAQTVFDFLDQVLRNHFELEWWSMYVDVGIQAEQSDKVIKKLQEVRSLNDLSPQTRRIVESSLRKCLLAVGRVDEGLEILRTMADSPEDASPEAASDQSRRMDAAKSMFKIGKLMKNDTVMNEGLDRMEALIEASMKDKNSESYLNFSYYAYEYVECLIELGRLEQAESFLLTALKNVLRQNPEKEYGRWQSYRENSSYLVQLVEIYYQANRPEDVLFLLDSSPWWGVTDIMYVSDIDIPVYTAWALHKTGRDDEAAEILKPYIFQRPDHDPAYELLCEVLGQDASDFFDSLYERDRFEERPLIWKAETYRRAGDLDTAETVIRQALKVDPTDGEQPAGSRVYAYKVLADILKAKGNDQDGNFFYSVVKSVRLAEHGDELLDAGLVSMSLEAYEEAAVFFADAYCVQWRLAERLREQGDLAEAEKHYKIVFERMPEQFGQYVTYFKESVMMPSAEIQSITFRLMELDPLGRHVSVNYDTIYNLKLLWQTMAANRKFTMKQPDYMYFLAASAQELEELRKKASAAGFGGMDEVDARMMYLSWSEVPDSGVALVSIPAVNEAIELIRLGEQTKMMYSY